MTGAQHLRNLLSVYDMGTDVERAEAHASYQRYHDLISLVARELGFPVDKAVGVFSALSPNNSYVSNLANCRTLLRAVKDGKTVEDVRVNTYHTNKRKAWRIATGEANPLDEFKGLKTKAFYLNCLDPTNPEPITVDGHMYWIYQGRKGVVKVRGPERKLTAPPHLSPKLYEEIADCVRFVAEHRGCIGCQAQAVLWQNWRRKHNVRGAAQMELIASDAFAIGQHEHKLAKGGCGQ